MEKRSVVQIDGGSLTLEELLSVTREEIHLEVSSDALKAPPRGRLSIAL